ncbi:hypothetical protein WS93_08845 [Burkholderia cepacia]|nr:hypothetical protein WS93_08845 [Burkholderia cepacia]
MKFCKPITKIGDFVIAPTISMNCQYQAPTFMFGFFVAPDVPIERCQEYVVTGFCNIFQATPLQISLALFVPNID